MFCDISAYVIKYCSVKSFHLPDGLGIVFGGITLCTFNVLQTSWKNFGVNGLLLSAIRSTSSP